MSSELWEVNGGFSAGIVDGLIFMENQVLEGMCLPSKQNQELLSQNLASTYQHIWGPYGPWFSPLENTYHFPSLVTLGPSLNREVFSKANDVLVCFKIESFKPNKQVHR